MSFKREYTELRKKGWLAKNAFSYAKTKAIFENNLNVRLRIVKDDLVIDIEDLKGDCFNPEVNNDIPESKLARQEKEFEERVHSEGVYGIVGEYRCIYDDTWKHADSVWGFVGDDWQYSGYDEDVMSQTLEAYNEAHK